MGKNRFELVIFDVFGYAYHSDRTALAEAGAKIVFHDMRQLSQLL
ncbi:HAD family hydrolase [Calothrix brevissima NIES-22]|nr:HAD family hydrolase [Calothrix brevissima NIES-22]